MLDVGTLFVVEESTQTLHRNPQEERATTPAYYVYRAAVSDKYHHLDEFEF